MRELVDAFLEKWTGAGSTLVGYRSIQETHIRPAIGRNQVRNVASRMLGAFRHPPGRKAAARPSVVEVDPPSVAEARGHALVVERVEGVEVLMTTRPTGIADNALRDSARSAGRDRTDPSASPGCPSVRRHHRQSRRSSC